MPSARVGAGSCRTAIALVLLFLPLTLLLLENASASSKRLAFSDSVQVVSSKVYLNDIMTVVKGGEILKQKAQNVVVATAPIPGKVKVIKKNQVLRALNRNNLNSKDIEVFIPDEIKITRKSRVYSKREIEALIRKELLKKNFIDNKNSVFFVNEIQKDVILPIGDIRALVKMPGRIKDSNKFWVSFYINGKLKNRIWAKGDIKRNMDVLAAKNTLTVNDIIKEDDLFYMSRNILELNGNYITNKAAVLGKKALINISRGALFKKESVGIKDTIKAGDMVNILAHTKNMTIKASGRVLSNKGSVGDTVNVLNVDSKEKLQAVVVNEKTVEVEVH
jgi:flagella basal body P-ring formation protein FlgA